MVIIGAIVTLLGLAGLIFCIIKAFKARNAGLKGKNYPASLKAL